MSPLAWEDDAFLELPAQVGATTDDALPLGTRTGDSATHGFSDEGVESESDSSWPRSDMAKISMGELELGTNLDLDDDW